MCSVMTGGCACGAVRYRITGAPVLSLHCFCTDCVAVCGTDGFAGMVVKNEAFEHTDGQTKSFTRGSKSGRSFERHFCPECGANLWGKQSLA
jgi:hypothetical protein